jgi:outer membrane biosynthesis protein TonB
MFRRTFCFLSIVLLLLSMAHRLPAPIVEPEEKPTPTPAQAPVPSPAQAQAPTQKEELSKRKRSTTSKTALKQQAATKPETRAKPTSPPRSQGTGRLIISRAPNFGWNIAVHLQIDGRGVGNITQGSRYDGRVPTGHHVLTVSAVGTPPTSVDLDVQAGRTYGFSAVWSSGVVVLRPST